MAMISLFEVLEQLIEECSRPKSSISDRKETVQKFLLTACLRILLNPQGLQIVAHKVTLCRPRDYGQSAFTISVVNNG